MKDGCIDLDEMLSEIAELEKENAEFKEQLYAFDEEREKLRKENADLEKENAELKADNDARKFAMAMSEKVEKQLREENAELKEISVMQSDFAKQLDNAKELMQKLIANAPDTYSGTNIELQQKKMFSFQDAVNKARQFLNSEVEK